MNKQKEKEILEMIFTPHNFIINEMEEPDFIITEKKNGNSFGVEVTEYFYTESDARLINIPNYLEKIINNGIYNNKCDKKRFPVEKVKVYPKGIVLDSESKEQKFIICNIPSRDELGNGIANTISKKNSKIINYKNNAEENDLIIYDNDNFMSGKGVGELYARVFNIQLIREIVNSEFREIYLITKCNNKGIYYKMKHSCFIFLVFLTLSFVKCFNLDNPNRFYLTLDILNGIGIKTKLLFSESEECIKLKYDNTVVCLIEENNELIVKNINTNEQLCNGIYEDFSPNNSIYNEIEEKYFGFLLSKSIIINLSNEVVSE